MGYRRSPRLDIQLPRVFHRASKSGSTHEPLGCMEQISWSEQVQYFYQAFFGVFENDRMLIAKAIVKKMGLQGLFSEDFEDKPMGSDCWGGCFKWEKKGWDQRY